MVLGRHKEMDLLIRWTPGHIGIDGNEEADVWARKAAQEGSSALHRLPAPLRKPLPYSKSANIQAFKAKLKRRAQAAWRKSPRYERIKNIDDSLPSPAFLCLITSLPRKHSALLIQLRSHHIPLAAHLHRIQKADSPTCPCCRRSDETVQHYLLECPAHASARREMHRAGGRDARCISKLLSKPELLPHLFRFIGRTTRFRSVFGEIPELEATGS